MKLNLLIYRLALSILLGTAASSVAAKDFIPRLGVDVEQHSNITLEPSGSEVEDTMITPYFGFQYDDKGEDLEAKVDFLLRHETYAENSFKEQDLFNINGVLDWGVMPGVLNWVVEDYAYSQRIDTTEDNTPDNVENFNVLATGPDFLFSHEIYDGVLKLRLADVYYSKSNNDNMRVIGSAAVYRPLNVYSRIGAEFSISNVKFDEVFLTDYTIASAHANYERETPYGVLNLHAGASWADHENGATDSAPLFEAKLASEEGLGQNYSISLSTKYSDPALDAYDPFFTSLLEISDQQTINQNEISGTGVYKQDRLELSYGIQGERLGFSLAGFSTKSNQLLSTVEDTKDIGGGANLSYLLTERAVIWVDGYYSRSEYVDIIDERDKPAAPEPLGARVDRYAEITGVGVGASYTLRDSLSFTLGARNLESQSDDPNRQYKDDILYFNVQYRGTPKN